jgi:hypothetical protein
MRRRKYVSGSKWCFWRWTDVDSEYITRLHFLKTPWFAICLHWLSKPDPEPYDHDHPVTFLSIILRGYYTEQREGVIKGRRLFNWVRAGKGDKHTITHVAPGTLTVALMGPKTREWGFHTPQGWVHWKDYYTKKRAGEPI